MEISAKKIAREAFPRLVDNLVFPRLVYTENAGNIPYRQGDIVSLRVPQVLTAREFDQSTGVTPEPMQHNTVDIRLEHIATVDMQVNAIEEACDDESAIKQFVYPAADAIAEKINSEGLSLYKDIPTVAGTAGTTPDSLDDIAAAALGLDMLRVPSGERFAVWNPTAAKELRQVPAIVNAEKRGSNSALRTGEIGMVLGIQNYTSQAVRAHTTAVTGVTAAASAEESENFVFTCTTGNIKRGDVICIDGDYHTAMSDAVEIEATTHTKSVKIFPKADYDTESEVSVTASHTANLVFHPNAFAFITKPLPAPAGVESFVTTHNGISLRVVKGYDMKYKRTTLSMDVLYAYKTINPLLAVRYLG